MNVEDIRNRLNKLKARVDPNFAPTDGDYFDDAVEDEGVELESMYGFFEGTLDQAEAAVIERWASSSQVFLADLIGVGEISIYAATTTTTTNHREKP